MKNIYSENFLKNNNFRLPWLVSAVGSVVGSAVGSVVGSAVGSVVGSVVGSAVGSGVAKKKRNVS